MDHAYKGFDSEGFYTSLAATVSAKKVNWKRVSVDTGVSASTLTRMAQGQNPDAPSLAALAAWAGLNPADFVGVRKPKPEALAEITALLRADPRLKPEGVKAMEAIIRAAYENVANKE